MNLQYIRYALEIARTGSISKAAENLSVAQPNLSRAVKELEAEVGIAIFERTRTGMLVTPDGERLLAAGERILREVGELSSMFEGDTAPREALTVAYPHADYILCALAELTQDLPIDGRYDLSYREVGPMDAMGMVAAGESRLGIIRFPAHNERYYTDRLAERELAWERLATLPAVILTAARYPIDRIGHRELNDASPITPADGSADTGRGEPPRRRIIAEAPPLLYALLRADPTLYAVTRPLTAETLSTLGLYQYAVADTDMAPVPEWQDALIYPKFYRPTALDRRLIDKLQQVAKR